MSKWLPIESAPIRDVVVIYHKSMWVRCAAKLEDGTWVKWPSGDYGDNDYIVNYTPTHWMPLPDDPKDEE